MNKDLLYKHLENYLSKVNIDNDLKERLEKEKLVIEVKVGENGKLFGAITNKEVSAELEKKFNVKIDRKKIDCSIKALGEHKAVLKLHPEVKAEMTVVTKG